MELCIAPTLIPMHHSRALATPPDSTLWPDPDPDPALVPVTRDRTSHRAEADSTPPLAKSRSPSSPPLCPDSGRRPSLYRKLYSSAEPNRNDSTNQPSGCAAGSARAGGQANCAHDDGNLRPNPPSFNAPIFETFGAIAGASRAANAKSDITPSVRPQNRKCGGS